jgi:hypothetical protein
MVDIDAATHNPARNLTKHPRVSGLTRLYRQPNIDGPVLEYSINVLFHNEISVIREHS